MPVPVSRTRSSAASSVCRIETAISPSKVNLKALDSKFRTIFSHIVRSTNAGSLKRGQSTRSVSPALSQAERKLLARSAVSSARAVGSYAARTRPASILEKSSKLLTRLCRRSPLRCTSSRRSRCNGGNGSFDAARASLTGPSIKVSGVRNSWLTLEKKMVLARAMSASASVRLRSSSYAPALMTALVMEEASES